MDMTYKAVIEQAMRTNEEFYRFCMYIKRPERYTPEELEGMFNKYIMGE